MSMGNTKENSTVKKNKALPYINIHFKATVIKICLISLGIEKQTKGTEWRHHNQAYYGYLIYDKVGTAEQWGNDKPFQWTAQDNEKSIWKENETWSYLAPCKIFDSN